MIVLEKIEDWQRVARRVAGLMQPGVWLWLDGPMGAGKTSCAKALFEYWGYEDQVPSPSYPLVIEYDFESFHVVHFDAYRLNAGAELPWDWEDWSDSVVIAEWPQNSSVDLSKFKLRLEILPIEDGKKREVRLHLNSSEIEI